MASQSQTERARRSRRSCPQCGSQHVARRHRRSTDEYLWSLVGIYPYKCESCHHRFNAWPSPRAPQTPDPDARWARCPNCHSTELNRIARKKVPPSWENLVWRLVRARAYRCPECRRRFFALRRAKAHS